MPVDAASPVSVRDVPVAGGGIWARICSLQMEGITLLFGLVSVLFGERPPVNGGTGWDGNIYFNLAIQFKALFFSHGIAPYYFQRILPCGVVAVLLKVLGIDKTEQNVVWVFEFYNLALLVIGVSLWKAIAAELRISRKGTWLGFFALFANFANAKFYFYYPCLTDQTAFFMGMLITYFFVKRNSIGVLLSAVLSAFCWPLALPFGLLLFAIPRPEAGAPASAKQFQARGALVAAAVATAITAYSCYAVLVLKFKVESPYLESAMPLSIALLWGYLFFALRPLASHSCMWEFRSIFSAKNVLRMLAAVAAYVAVGLFVKYMTNPAGYPESQRLTTIFFVNVFLARPLVMPGLFFAGHTAWLGLALAAMIVTWRLYCKEAGAFGLGATAFVFMSILFGVNTESRQLIFSMPLLVIISVAVIDRFELPKSFYWLFGALSVLNTKAWLLFHTPPFDPNLNYFEWPWQKYMSAAGCMMNFWSWLIYISVTIVLVAIGWGYVKVAKPKASSREA